MYMLKSEMFPSFILVLMGSIDCLTTVIGVLYFGAVELNPFMSGIVSSNIAAFMVVKILATFCIGATYILSKRMLNKTVNKNTRSFKLSRYLIKGAYAGLMVFLIAVVANNLIVLLA